MEGSRAVLYKWIFTQSMCVSNIPLRVPSSQLVNPPPQKNKNCSSIVKREKRLKKLHFHANIVFMNGMK